MSQLEIIKGRRQHKLLLHLVWHYVRCDMISGGGNNGWLDDRLYSSERVCVPFYSRQEVFSFSVEKRWILIYSMWYDFCEFRVIIVLCSSTDRVTAVRWMLIADCVTLEDEVDAEYFCLTDDDALPPSLSVPLPLPVADLKRSIDSWKLGPLSMVLFCVISECCCCCCWTCCCWTCCWKSGRLLLNGDDVYALRNDPSS